MCGRMYVSACMYACVEVCIDVCMCVCVYVCMCACVYMFVRVHAQPPATGNDPTVSYHDPTVKLPRGHTYT
jgi:hypothetical protein